MDNGSDPPLVLDGHYPFAARMLREPQPGSYAARNTGAAAATGELFAFLDADCWPEGEWLARGVDAMLAHGGQRLVGGEVAFATPGRTTAVALYQQITGFGQASNVRDKGFAATANLFCTRAQYELVGPFDTRLLSGGDREWCWRAHARGYRVEYQPNAIVHTLPRSDLAGAIRQARRVTAGRSMLGQLGLAHIGDHALRKQRSAWRSLTWLLGRDDLRLRDRIRVLAVAGLIHAATWVEQVRLALGTQAERR